MLLVCYNLLNCQNIANLSINENGWLLQGYLRRVAKKAAEVAQKKEQQVVHGEFYP